MRASLTPTVQAPMDDPEVRRLVLEHVERRRRDRLRQAAECSLAQRLLGSGSYGPTEHGQRTRPLHTVGEAL